MFLRSTTILIYSKEILVQQIFYEYFTSGARHI